MGRPNKQKVPSSEEEEEDQEEFEGEDYEEEDGVLHPYPHDYEQDEEERNQELLAMIQEKANNSSEGEQLTWNAIYALKKREGELSEEMNKEIEALKEKYELLKQPLYKQISQVALGNKVEAKLYRPEGLPCRGDPSKTNPLPIPNFWGEIFEKEGLLNSEADVDCIQKIKEFTCELLSQKDNHIRITFKFTSPPAYFHNTELQVDTKFDLEKNDRSRQIREEIKYKKERDEKSIFTMLFDSKTDVQETCNFATELYQDYSNAIFFYFSQEEEDEEEDEEEEEEDEEDEDEEVQPVRKDKKGKAKKDE